VMSSSIPPTTNAPPSSKNDVPPTEVDLTAHPTAQKLVSRCRDFFSEVEDLYTSLSSIPLPQFHTNHSCIFTVRQATN
jgi:hypothetical protein